MKFGAFGEHELQLIAILWNKGKVKHNEPLTARDTVLETIGNTKENTRALRDLYKKLINHNYVFRKIGYFSKVDFPQEENPVNYAFDLGEY